MNLLKKACFIFLLLNLSFLLFVDSYYYHDDENNLKYDFNIPMLNRTCKIPWQTSLFWEPYSSCWVMCKGRCILLSFTVQWRCVKSKNELWGNCYCCRGEFHKLHIPITITCIR